MIRRELNPNPRLWAYLIGGASLSRIMPRFERLGSCGTIMSMKLSHVFALIAFVAVSQLAGIIGSAFTMPSLDGWYVALAKPAFNPPAWIFGPVWTVLYVLMGIAAFLVWKKGWGRKGVKTALAVFAGQLALNALWSIIFFGLRNPAGALINIAFLWLAILATIVAFAKISKPAAWLLAPYILWVSFAAYLNFAILMLN